MSRKLKMECDLCDRAEEFYENSGAPGWEYATLNYRNCSKQYVLCNNCRWPQNEKAKTLFAKMRAWFNKANAPNNGEGAERE